MSENLEKAVRDICQACGDDRGRMMDIVRGLQDRFGQVSSKALDLIAARVGARRVEVESEWGKGSVFSVLLPLPG